MDSDTLIREIIERIPGLVVVYNIHTGQYIFVNDSIKKILGYDKQVFLDLGVAFVSTLVHPDDIPLIFEKNKQALRTANLKKSQTPESIVNFEYRMKHKNGSYIWFHTDGVVFDRNKRGKVEHVMNISIDITGRKEKELKEKNKRESMESELGKSEERLRLATEAGDIGVWDWEIDSNVLTWTKKVYELHGMSNTKQAVTVDYFMSLIHSEDKAFVQEAINNSIKSKKPYNINLRIITPGGETRVLTTSAVGIYDQKGKAIRMIGATSDITNQTRLEQDRSDFISIATHELKTPVTSIKAYAEVLQRKFAKAGDFLSADQLGKMNSQLDKLTSLISDLLDATKVESGKLQMHEEEFNFDELTSEIVEELQRTTEKHRIIIKGKTDQKIQADRERTGQVLTNLISNAIKYSPQTDKVLVKLSKKVGQVQVCVQDFGIGIPKEKQSKLFDRFYRVSGPSDNTFPGLGLGLYISSEIVKRQGGRIWVESTIGKGSVFCFSLPLKIK